jgi:predicted permease
MEWLSVVRGGVAREIRSLRRSPGFVGGVVLTLSLGIGANAAMFGILDRLMLRGPAHIVEPDEMRRVVVERPRLGQMAREATIAYPDFAAFKENHGFERVAAFSGPIEETMGSGSDAGRVRVAFASWDYFPLLGVTAMEGRFFASEEDRTGASPLAVVSFEFWRSRMGAESKVLGRTIRLSGDTYTIIGVAPEGFTGVNLAPVDVWVPLATAGALAFGPYCVTSRACAWLKAVVRMAPGADPDAAAAEATAEFVNGRREEIKAGEYPTEARIVLDPLIAARGPEASGESRVAKWLGGVSLIVLLIACANTANLLLARGVRRQREVAVRLALGAGRRRLVTTMVLEAVSLAVLGGAAGLLLSRWMGWLLRGVLLPGVLFPESAVSSRVLLFTLATAVVAGVFSGVGPALQVTRHSMAEHLAKAPGAMARRHAPVRIGLVVTQVALSTALLIGAGLFVRSVWAVRHLDLGLDVDRLVLATLEIETAGTGRIAAPERNQLYGAAMERLARTQGVAAVAATNSPFQWEFSSDIKVPGRDSVPRLPGGGPYSQSVTPTYLRTVGLRVLQGRDLLPSDDAQSPRVAVISETMAKALWPHDDPIGKCFQVQEDECIEVVGVTEDASRGELESEPFMAYYLPIAQDDETRLNALYVRARGDPGRLAPTVASVLRGLDTRVRYASVQPLRAKIDPQARSWTLGATMCALFGLLALVVAAFSLYSVLAFEVARRTREMGIRSALGARRENLIGIVVTDGVRLAALGLVLGMGSAFLAAPRMQGLLFPTTSSRDPLVFTVVAVTLLGVAAVASLRPALRSARADPVAALRSE